MQSRNRSYDNAEQEQVALEGDAFGSVLCLQLLLAAAAISFVVAADQLSGMQTDC